MFTIFFIPKNACRATSVILRTDIPDIELAQQTWDSLDKQFTMISTRP
jgi:hypothetical protein